MKDYNHLIAYIRKCIISRFNYDYPSAAHKLIKSNNQITEDITQDCLLEILEAINASRNEDISYITNKITKEYIERLKREISLDVIKFKSAALNQ